LNDITPLGKRVFSGQNLFLLISLALGHTFMHCLQQGWYIVLPSVKESFGLNDLQYGSIESVRSASNTVVQLPSGAVSDILRKRWVSIIVSALMGVALSYAILGMAPNYSTVLFAAVLIGISIALWHPSALSVLSARLAQRRGLALSVHGMGGNLGNAVGPAITGSVIGIVAWQAASWIMAAPLVLFAILLALLLRNMPGREDKHVTGRQFVSALICLLKNKTILGLVITGSIRGMGTICIYSFFSLYLREDLSFSPAKAGLYYTIMMASGIFSQPLMGYLSDRFGRKIVMVPSLFVMGVLQILLIWVGDGIGLAAVAAGIGLFIYAIGAVIQAAAMDASPEEAGATTIALLFGSQALFTIPSPAIAGWLSGIYGIHSVFVYSGGLVLISAAILIFLPIDGKQKFSESLNSSQLG